MSIPEEVQRAVQGVGFTLDTNDLRFYEKAKIDRGSAWVRTLQTAPPVPLGWQWIWRKSHTACYWVWYISGLYDPVAKHRVRPLTDPQPGDRVKHTGTRALGTIVEFNGSMNSVTVRWDDEAKPVTHPTHVIRALDIIEQIAELDS